MRGVAKTEMVGVVGKVVVMVVKIKG